MGEEPSLIQQRMALDRARIAAIAWIAFPAALALIMVIGQIGREPSWYVWAPLAAVAVLGVTRLWTVEKRRRRFEAEHGRGAARQRPAGR